MPPSLIRIQRLFIIAGYLITVTAQGSRSAIRGKRSDEVAADEDKRIMAAVARHIASLVDTTRPAMWSHFASHMISFRRRNSRPAAGRAPASDCFADLEK